MAILRNGNNLAYGFNNALQTLAPQPIFAKRAPLSSDVAELGTIWIYQASPAQIYIFTSGGVWSQLVSDAGEGIFSSLTVNGDSVLNGGLVVDSGSSAIDIGTDAVAKAIAIGNGTGATSVTIDSGTEGINIGTNSVAQTITIGNDTGTTALVFNAGSGLSSFNSGVATAPVASSVATAAFVTSLTAGTSVHNTTGYDLLCNITLIISSATTATITLGVGPATGPTTSTVVPSFSAASSIIVPISAWVPSGYYLVYNHTGTITVASATVQSCPL